MVSPCSGRCSSATMISSHSCLLQASLQAAGYYVNPIVSTPLTAQFICSWQWSIAMAEMIAMFCKPHIFPQQNPSRLLGAFAKVTQFIDLLC